MTLTVQTAVKGVLVLQFVLAGLLLIGEAGVSFTGANSPRARL